VVPEIIHTPPTEGHWKFLGGGEGGLKAKLLEGQYEAKLEFPGGCGGAKQKTYRGGSMDLFWNYTIVKFSVTVQFQIFTKTTR